MKLYGAALAALMLVGCSMEGEVERDVRAQLRDPDSAVFSDVVRKGEVACGYVNGANAFGGMAGRQRFVWISGTAHIEPGNPPQELPSNPTYDEELEYIGAVVRSCRIRTQFARCQHPDITDYLVITDTIEACDPETLMANR